MTTDQTKSCSASDFCLCMQVQRRVSAPAVCPKSPCVFRCIRPLPLHVAKLRDIAMEQDSHTSAAGNELTRMHADSRSALTDRAASLHEVGKLLVMEAWLSNDLPVLSCKLLHLMASIWALVTQEPLHLLHKGQLGACRAVCDLGHGQLGCSTGCTVSPCCLATCYY